MTFGRRKTPNTGVDPINSSRTGPTAARTQGAFDNTIITPERAAYGKQSALFELLLSGIAADDPRRRVLQGLEADSHQAARTPKPDFFQPGTKKIVGKIVTEDCLGAHMNDFLYLLNCDLAQNDPLRLKLDGEWNSVSLVSLGQGGSDGVSFLLEARELFFDAQDLNSPRFLNELLRSVRARLMTPATARAQIKSFTAAIRAHIAELDG